MRLILNLRGFSSTHMRYMAAKLGVSCFFPIRLPHSLALPYFLKEESTIWKSIANHEIQPLEGAFICCKSWDATIIGGMQTLLLSLICRDSCFSISSLMLLSSWKLQVKNILRSQPSKLAHLFCHLTPETVSFRILPKSDSDLFAAKVNSNLSCLLYVGIGRSGIQ